MAERRMHRSRPKVTDVEPEEAFRLDDVLEPDEPVQPYVPQHRPQSAANANAYRSYSRNVPDDDSQFMVDEASEEEAPDAPETEEKYRFASGILNGASIVVGIACIFVLIALIVMLVSWVKTDLLQSAVLLTGSLQ